MKFLNNFRCLFFGMYAWIEHTSLSYHFNLSIGWACVAECNSKASQTTMTTYNWPNKTCSISNRLHMEFRILTCAFLTRITCVFSYSNIVEMGIITVEMAFNHVKYYCWLICACFGPNSLARSRSSYLIKGCVTRNSSLNGQWKAIDQAI